MAAAGAEGGGDLGRGKAELRGDVTLVGAGRAAERVTPRLLRSWGLMGKVLAGAGGSCGACGTAVVAREAARTGLPRSGKTGRQAAGGSGEAAEGSETALRRPMGPGRKAQRGVGQGEQQGSADRAAVASRRSDPGRSAVVRCSPGVWPRCPCAPQPFEPSSLFELEPQACPPDSVTPFGPRGSVSSHFCVRRASSQAPGSFPLLSLASHLFPSCLLWCPQIHCPLLRVSLGIFSLPLFILVVCLRPSLPS